MPDVVVKITESDAGAPVYGTITMNEGTGVDQPIGRITKMPAKRIAWMAVSRMLFEELCSKDVTAFFELSETVAAIGPADWKWVRLDEWRSKVCEKVHDALLLPANATVVGVSLAFRFACNEVAIQVECPDFVETPEGAAILRTDAVYEKFDGLVDNMTRFKCWSNMEGGKMKYEIRTFKERVESLCKGEPLGPCWQCGCNTPRSVGDSWECEECGRKPLL